MRSHQTRDQVYHLIALFPVFFGICIAACILNLRTGSGIANLLDSKPAETAAFPVAIKPPIKVVTRNIEDLRVGDRVLAKNPLIRDDERTEGEPSPETWRQVDLAITKLDGYRLDITLLRPRQWLEDRKAKVGSMVELDIPEMKAYGSAVILAIQPCPPIMAGGGRVVTGTYRHSSSDILDLCIEGEAAPIGTTTDHPFWSEDRRQFVPAETLAIGEQLRTHSGRLVRLTSKTLRSTPAQVHNLEVQTENVYYVGSIGVLVHNYPAKGDTFHAVDEIEVHPKVRQRMTEDLGKIAPGMRDFKVVQFDANDLLCHAHACGLNTNLPFIERRFGGQLDVLQDIYSKSGFSRKPFDVSAIDPKKQQIVVYGEQFGDLTMVTHSARVRSDGLLESKLGPGGHYVIVHQTIEELSGPGYGKPLFIFEK